MKLLIVRHGDPDYSIDSLTETGWIEAELLSDRLCKLDVKAFYCSPKGRARDTAKATLEKLGRQAEILPMAAGILPAGSPPGEGQAGRRMGLAASGLDGRQALLRPGALVGKRPLHRRRSA